MEATAVHRDRAARHHTHHKIVCISSAPTAARTLQRRSRRAAERAMLLDLVAEALDERYAVQNEVPSE
jgi:hypothetical protein